MQENDFPLTLNSWNTSLFYDGDKRLSEICKAKDYYTDWYKRWCSEISETPRFHRKQWEFAYIMQALWERGCIAEGMNGLVFAVGTEPLPSVFAKYGCSIMATDLHPAQGQALGWTHDNQLCFGVEALNTRKLCPANVFEEKVRYRPVDMNQIPQDLSGFDFNWSSCSFEHLGSIKKGLAFLKNQMKTLKPGGWAVHTTEFNIASNDRTVENNITVVFRMKDIETIANELRKDGHFVEELDYSLGGLPEDYYVDIFPYKQEIHLRLQMDGFVVSSIGLIIKKGEPGLKRKMFNFFK